MRSVVAGQRRVAGSFYGWRVLVSMMTVRAVGGGINLYGASLFILPLQEDLELSRGIVSTLFASGLLIRHLTSPISGLLIDRFGARKMLFNSLLLSGAGYILLSAVSNVALLFVVFVGMVSLGFHVLLFQAPSVITNNWFDRRKALAMSLLQVGAGIGGAVLVPAIGAVILTWGWRPGSILAGAALIALGLPAVLMAKNTPEEMGLQPDGTARRPQTASTQAGTEGMALAAAMRTAQYWLIVVTMVSFSAAAGAVAFHFVPIVAGKGLSEATATGLLSIFALLSVPVIVLSGWLGDRTNRFVISGLTIMVVAMGVAVLNIARDVAALAVATLLMAGTQGVYPLLWAATGELFGRRGFGAIRGSIEGFFVIGLAAPALMGFLQDWQGDYAVSLWGAFGLCVLSASIALFTPRMNSRRGSVATRRASLS